MCCKFGYLLTAALLFVLAGRVPAQNAPPTDAENFTFLDITDLHVNAQGSVDALRKLTDEALQMSPKPAFVVANGDLTETGTPAEIAKLKEAIAPLEQAGIKFHAIPGNYDVRWSPDGKESFERAFGKTYQSFDHGGAHFILLDTTVPLEHWGHLDKAELEWLKKDLAKVKPQTPLFVFMHHWIGRDRPSVRVVDNEFDLVPILRSRNVIAIFTGHGRQDLAWQTNGVRTFMSEGLFQTHGSYYRVNVSKLLVTLDRQFLSATGEPYHATIPIANKSHPSILKAEWDDPDNAFLSRRRPQASLNPRAVTDNPDKETAEYRIDDGPYKPLLKDKRDLWRQQFETKDIAIGVHTADVRLTTSNNITYEDELIFELERNNTEPTQKWAINLDGPIQSTPLLLNDLLIVGSSDGKCYGLELMRGRKKWTFPTKGQFIASPVLDGNTVYLGSTDHYLYALESGSGRQKWRYDTGGPIFATAAVAQNTVCIGAKGKIIGVDANTGKFKWSVPTTALFQSRATTDGSAFYLGGWDNTLYAIDAANGATRWTVRMGVDKNKQLTSTYSPAIAAPTLANNRVYICSNDGVLHVLNAQTGKEAWIAAAPTASDPFGYSTPAVVGPNVYLAGLGKNGDVYCLDAGTGSIQWRESTGQTIYDSSPRLAPDGKTLAIMGVRGRVSVLDTHTGKRVWGYELGPGNIFSTPEYDGQHVYTTTMANDVQCINAPGVGGIERRQPRTPATDTPGTTAK